ncbi:MAG: PilZ domain-containing protein [Deltaproteobacteria bacterium]|nr:MAG: PilZ domain-containing protein [Deltaproteobacteria bacterium]
MAVCRTLDVSDGGLSLDTAAWFPLGTRLAVALVEPTTGTAIELIGDVVREAAPPSWTLGILLIEPPVEWQAVVAAAAHRSSSGPIKPAKRMRVLVFGDDARQRGAMALYVTSGWDVLFVTDEDSIADALDNIELDAVVAELDVTRHRPPAAADHAQRAAVAAVRPPDRPRRRPHRDRARASLRRSRRRPRRAARRRDRRHPRGLS